ncbi:glycerophosphodiester phosphodiesterase family protein [Rhizobium lusitanum]|uniref:Glycerophosphoryl diester phosphodiesterase n=1 Tax=Rhizobium lusitanum TaxID=293958 RepID=A0A7X0MHU4_9HYPH|nr:glycerophosphodiester phosphodiesterase family protein [Rhizobium lusitanum]MBB6489503.1 glycerophosphoryl diester phosphodiesterase [Rhizobium lusitanum]
MTKIIGHRGARNIWPENSLTGFRNVLDLDVDAIEFDVHLTDVGELVVIHDASLDRTTDRIGPVRDLTIDMRLETHLQGTLEVLPTLSDVLAVFESAARKCLHIEIKSDAAGRPYPGIVEKVVAEIEWFGMADRCHLTSFDLTVIEECRRVAPHIDRLVSANAASIEREGGLSAFLTNAVRLVEIVAIHHELLQKEWVQITQMLAPEQLCVWTLNDEALIRSWLERGIGYLTSDQPDLALSLRSGIGALPASRGNRPRA